MLSLATPLAQVRLIEPSVFHDARGAFYESYNRRRFREATGLNVEFVQDNHSRSIGGVLRGLHYQIGRPQGKLVRVTRGAIWDVAVDLRRGSPTLGRWFGTRLDAERPTMLWIPEGYAHGFYVLGDGAEVLYKATDYYAPEAERTIRWDDPDLAIDWPIPAGAGAPLVSDKDRGGLSFREAPLFD
jgi:dTDP-4-dehydrorhamnose 3,5-epimerase